MCTLYIDPPYQNQGKYYEESTIEYDQLGDWCLGQAKDGHQVIVCENLGADWLPFKPLVELHGQKKKSVEAIWYSEDYRE